MADQNGAAELPAAVGALGDAATPRDSRANLGGKAAPPTLDVSTPALLNSARARAPPPQPAGRGPDPFRQSDASLSAGWTMTRYSPQNSPADGNRVRCAVQRSW